jgi:NTE family protein
VLKVLEEYRIPIDLIVGTSMGAIVGGLYAAGISPSEMEEVVRSVDWGRIFDDRPPDQYLAFRRKGHADRLPIWEIGIRKGRLVLPRGLTTAQKLGFLLQSLTLHTADTESFDDLPIPFRALATDLGTGELVVLDRGSLASALRASMAVPGAFSPVELNGRTLVDGGVVDNFPVDVARKLGAEVIIAVYVGMSLDELERSRSVLEVSVQAMSVQAQQHYRDQVALLTKDDVLVDVPVSDTSSASFVEMAKLIGRGEEGARAQAERLSRLSLPPEVYWRFLGRQRLVPRDLDVIDFVRVSSDGPATEARIASLIRTPVGEPLDLEILQEDLNRVYAVGDFEEVGFRIVNEDGRRGLVVRALPRSWGPNTVRFGFGIADDFDGDARYDMLTGIALTRINRLGGEWVTDARFGGTLGLESEFYQPLDLDGTHFVSTRLRAERSISDVYEEGDRVGRYQVGRVGAEIGLGANLGTTAQVGASALVGRYWGQPLIGGVGLASESANLAGLLFSVDIDRIDNGSFPRTGVGTLLSLYVSDERIWASDTYEVVLLGVIKPITAGRHTFMPFARAATGLGSNIPKYSRLPLGGLFNFSGYREGRLTGNHGGVAGLIYYARVADISGSWARSLYVGASAETAGAWEEYEEINPADLIVSGSLFVGLDTGLGPLYLAYALAQDGGWGRIYLYVGQTL